MTDSQAIHAKTEVIKQRQNVDIILHYCYYYPSTKPSSNYIPLQVSPKVGNPGNFCGYESCLGPPISIALSPIKLTLIIFEDFLLN